MATFADLLADQDLPRAYLMHARPYDPAAGVLTDVYLSADAHAPLYDGKLWRARLLTVLDYGAGLGDVTQPRGEMSVGRIEIAISDGELSELAGYQWDGRAITVYMGDPAGAFSGFSAVFSGRALDVSFDADVMRIVLRDPRHALDTPIQGATYGGTGGYDGGPDLAGVPMPLCFGQCYNIEPVLIDATRLIYQVHERQVNNISRVLDRAADLTSAGSVSDVYNWTPVAGRYVVDLVRGLIRLGAQPDGAVTCDVQGEASGGYVQSGADIIKRIVAWKAGAGAPPIDTAAFTSVNSARPWVCGLYLRDGGGTIREAIDRVAESLGAWTDVTPAGSLTMRLLAFGTPALTLDETDYSGFEALTTEPPAWRVRIGYRRSHLVQRDDQVAGGGAEDIEIPPPGGNWTNLILNPNFEDGEKHWTLYANAAVNATAAQAFDGTRSLVRSGSGSSYTGIVAQNANKFAVSPGEKYVISGRAKTSGDGIGGVRLYFYDSAGGYITNAGADFIGIGGTYVERIATVTVPSGAVTAIPAAIVDGHSTGDWRFDKLRCSISASGIHYSSGGTLESVAVNFSNRNDRNAATPIAPTFATNGTAIDHAINTDSSADISIEWGFSGAEDQIDGFMVYVRASSTGGAYTIGSAPAEEHIEYVPPTKRAVILRGVPANRYYTFAVRSYRIVDPDISAVGLLYSAVIQPSASGENPYRPSANVAFQGDITGTIQGQSAATIKDAAVNFNNRNDRNAATPTAPTFRTDGTAVDHVVNTDASVDISVEWDFGGAESQIDGFMFYTRSSTSSAAYTMGTTPAEERVEFMPPHKRAVIVQGVPANRYYTFAVRAYRIVDPDIDASERLYSAVVQPSASGENPYRPSANVAFQGDIIGTIDGQAAATVRSNATAGKGASDDLDGSPDFNRPTKRVVGFEGEGALARKNKANVGDLNADWSGLVADGSFEAGTRDWTLFNGGYISSVRRTGAQGLSRQGGASGYLTVGQNKLLFSALPGEKFYLLGGVTYHTAIPDGLGRVMIQWYDAAGGYVSGSALEWSVADVDAVGGGGQWRTKTGIFSAPSNAVSGRVECGVYNHTVAGSYWGWDDITCTRAIAAGMVASGAVRTAEIGPNAVTSHIISEDASDRVISVRVASGTAPPAYSSGTATSVHSLNGLAVSGTNDVIVLEYNLRIDVTNFVAYYYADTNADGTADTELNDLIHVAIERTGGVVIYQETIDQRVLASAGNMIRSNGSMIMPISATYVSGLSAGNYNFTLKIQPVDMTKQYNSSFPMSLTVTNSFARATLFKR